MKNKVGNLESVSAMTATNTTYTKVSTYEKKKEDLKERETPPSICPQPVFQPSTEFHPQAEFPPQSAFQFPNDFHLPQSTFHPTDFHPSPPKLEPLEKYPALNKADGLMAQFPKLETRGQHSPKKQRKSPKSRSKRTVERPQMPEIYQNSLTKNMSFESGDKSTSVSDNSSTNNLWKKKIYDM